MREIGVLQATFKVIQGFEYLIQLDTGDNDGMFRVRAGNHLADAEWSLSPDLSAHFRASATEERTFLVTREAEDPSLADAVRLTFKRVVIETIGSAAAYPS